MRIRLDTAEVRAINMLGRVIFEVYAAADMSDDYVWIATFATRQMAEDYAYIRKMPIHYDLNQEGNAP